MDKATQNKRKKDTSYHPYLHPDLLPEQGYI